MVWYGMVWFGVVWYGLVWFVMVWEVLQLNPRGRLEDLVARVEDNFLKLCTSQARNSHAWLASEIFSSMSRWAEHGPHLQTGSACKKFSLFFIGQIRIRHDKYSQ